MSQKTFPAFLAAMHKYVHSPEAAYNDAASYHIGYAIGKLISHYTRKMSPDAVMEFDRGMTDGLLQGVQRVLH